MEEDVTPAHVLLTCTGVSEQGETVLSLSWLLSNTPKNSARPGTWETSPFWSELGWLEIRREPATATPRATGEVITQSEKKTQEQQNKPSLLQ